jgi:hypothetical protein
MRGRQRVLTAFSPDTTRAELAATYQVALERETRGAYATATAPMRATASAVADASDA